MKDSRQNVEQEDEIIILSGTLLLFNLELIIILFNNKVIFFLNYA